MPKGPYLTPLIKNLIAEIYDVDRTAGPTVIRKELLKRMKAKGLDENFGPDYPSVSAVSKELKERRWRDENRSPQSKALDGPWHLLTLATHDISPEAIPYIMRIQALKVEQGGHPLTIREARWAAWLSRFVDSMPRQLKKVLDVNHLLMFHAIRYARSERIYELLGETGRLPDTQTEKWLLLHQDAVLYAWVTGDNKPLRAAAKKLSEISPEAYRAINADDDGPPPEEKYEQLTEALEKEVQNER